MGFQARSPWLWIGAWLLVATAACASGSAKSPVAASCAYTVSLTNARFAAAGGSGSVTVTTGSACSWTAATQASWIELDTGPHSGSGTAAFTIDATDQAGSRNATIVAGGQSLGITQDGRPTQACSYSLSASPDHFERDGGAGTVTVTAPAGCSWSVKTDASWATIQGPADGSGSAALHVAVQANIDLPTRFEKFVINDVAATISQPGQGDCTYQVSPTFAAFPRTEWTAAVDIWTESGCRWTAASDSGWLHVTTMTGSGAGRLTYQADFNPGDAYQDRAATVSVQGLAQQPAQQVRVSQSGDCGVAVYRQDTGWLYSYTVPAGGGSYRLEGLVASPLRGCTWTVTGGSAWLTIDRPGTGTLYGNDDYFIVTAQPNAGAARDTTLLLGGAPFVIYQQGR